jgi:phage terminase large subunit GpA-like protein
MMVQMTPAAGAVAHAFARGLKPDPNMPLDEWSDEYMIIPKSAGASEYGKYRTSRTPHARAVMRALSDGHPCKRVVVKGASQMLKTQVGLNWFACSVHQSPTNFLWIAPTGKLQKRASTRIGKTIDAVEVVRERVAAPRSRDSVNTMDTKEYEGGALTIVTAGAAANLSELSVRRVLYDEIDRTPRNVDGEGASWKLGEARQTSFERNRKSYYPSSPTIEDESEIDDLFKMGTQKEALADCVHCGVEQPLVFERLKPTDDNQGVYYPCFDCGGAMYETDKNRMFARGAWSEGVAGDGETESFTISAMFLPYGWASWLVLYKEYQAAKVKHDQGDETLMITFYNTRLARVWARTKEQTKYEDLWNRAKASTYRLGMVPAPACVVTASIDTQGDRLEFKAVAWAEGLEGFIVDFQVIDSDPALQTTWDRAAELCRGQYRHAGGELLSIDAIFVDSGGNHTQEVYTFCDAMRREGVHAIKGESRPGKPIIGAKPTIVHFDERGKGEKRSGKLWWIGTDSAKDALVNRWKIESGPGAIHFPNNLEEDYFKQLTAEYRIPKYQKGHRYTTWEKKPGDRNEALDLMVYNLAAAHHIGLHKKSDLFWENMRKNLNPPNLDLFKQPAPVWPEPVALPSQVEEDVPATSTPAADSTAPPPASDPPAPTPARIVRGRISLSGTKRGGA